VWGTYLGPDITCVSWSPFSFHAELLLPLDGQGVTCSHASLVDDPDASSVMVELRRQGNRYIPSIVRVGLSVHHSVAAVSLDALVEQRMRSAKARPCRDPRHSPYSANRLSMHLSLPSISSEHLHPLFS